MPLKWPVPYPLSEPLRQFSYLFSISTWFFPIPLHTFSLKYLQCTDIIQLKFYYIQRYGVQVLNILFLFASFHMLLLLLMFLSLCAGSLNLEKKSILPYLTIWHVCKIVASWILEIVVDIPNSSRCFLIDFCATSKVDITIGIIATFTLNKEFLISIASSHISFSFLVQFQLYCELTEKAISIITIFWVVFCVKTKSDDSNRVRTPHCQVQAQADICNTTVNY